MKDQLVSIQVLRAIAALAVVAFHFTVSLQQDFHLTTDLLFQAGASGVDVFFVISGFIMSYTTAGLGQRSPASFAFKRLARIVPLYWVMTLAVFGLGLVAPALFHLGGASPGQLLKSLFFIPYTRPDGMNEPVLFLGWTLNYEMFFYSVFAVALMISRRFYLFITMGAIAALTVLHPFAHGGVLTAFYTDSIMLEFVWGCLLFLVFQRWPRAVSALSPVWVPGAMLLLAQNFFEPGWPRGIEKGLPALLIVGGVLGSEMKDGVLRRAFARIGDASYSLYLGHPYALAVSVKLAIALLGASILSATVAGVAGLTLAILGALASYFLLERPSNAWLRRQFGGPKPPAVTEPVLPA
jgi:exopolysaccharide production protein ExoZ